MPCSRLTSVLCLPSSPPCVLAIVPARSDPHAFPLNTDLRLHLHGSDFALPTTQFEAQAAELQKLALEDEQRKEKARRRAEKEKQLRRTEADREKKERDKKKREMEDEELRLQRERAKNEAEEEKKR
jgi:hypothetical protein